MPVKVEQINEYLFSNQVATSMSANWTYRDTIAYKKCMFTHWEDLVCWRLFGRVRISSRHSTQYRAVRFEPPVGAHGRSCQSRILDLQNAR